MVWCGGGGGGGGGVCVCVCVCVCVHHVCLYVNFYVCDVRAFVVWCGVCAMCVHVWCGVVCVCVYMCMCGVEWCVCVSVCVCA